MLRAGQQTRRENCRQLPVPGDSAWEAWLVCAMPPFALAAAHHSTRSPPPPPSANGWKNPIVPYVRCRGAWGERWPRPAAARESDPTGRAGRRTTALRRAHRTCSGRGRCCSRRRNATAAPTPTASSATSTAVHDMADANLWPAPWPRGAAALLSGAAVLGKEAETQIVQYKSSRTDWQFYMNARLIDVEIGLAGTAQVRAGERSNT